MLKASLKIIFGEVDSQVLHAEREFTDQNAYQKNTLEKAIKERFVQLSEAGHHRIQKVMATKSQADAEPRAACEDLAICAGQDLRPFYA